MQLETFPRKRFPSLERAFRVNKQNERFVFIYFQNTIFFDVIFGVERVALRNAHQVFRNKIKTVKTDCRALTLKQEMLNVGFAESLWISNVIGKKKENKQL